MINAPPPPETPPENVVDIKTAKRLPAAALDERLALAGAKPGGHLDDC